MELKEFYTAAEGDYNETLSRLMKDERILKYLRLFPQNEDYAQLSVNLEKPDYKEAFRNIHTIKGMALNLGLTKLASVSSALCEELRQGPPKIDITQMRADVKCEYEKIIKLIAELG